MSEMKVEKKPGSFYILGYLLELIVEIWRFEFFSFQNLANMDHFSHEKSFVLVEIAFFRLNYDIACLI
jgi:hypothetical protein